MPNSSILPIDKTLSGTINLGQSEPGNDYNEGVLGIPPNPSLLEPHHQIVTCHIQDASWRWVLPFGRDAVGVFYIPS